MSFQIRQTIYAMAKQYKKKKNKFIQKQFPKLKTSRWPKKKIFLICFSITRIYISHKRVYISDRMVQWEIIKSDIMLFIYIHCRLKTTSCMYRTQPRNGNFHIWNALLVLEPSWYSFPELFAYSCKRIQFCTSVGMTDIRSHRVWLCSATITQHWYIVLPAQKFILRIIRATRTRILFSNLCVCATIDRYTNKLAQKSCITLCQD